jgi:hypothetical protein
MASEAVRRLTVKKEVKTLLFLEFCGGGKKVVCVTSAKVIPERGNQGDVATAKDRDHERNSSDGKEGRDDAAEV